MYVGRERSWPEWLEIVRVCEEAGIEGLFIGDHYLSMSREAGEPGRFDAWTLLGGLAAVTTTIRLGTIVTPVTFRPAAVTAKVVTTADNISSGRVELGLGAGWMEAEHRFFGLPFPPLAQRLDMLEEHVVAITRQWAELEPGPVQRPRPRLFTGGAGKPRTVALAARHFDEYNRFLIPPEEVAAFRETLDRAGGERVAISIAANCLITDDRAAEEAFRAVAASAANRFGEPDRTAVVGSAARVRDRLEQFAAAGVSRVYLRHNETHGPAWIERVAQELLGRIG